MSLATRALVAMALTVGFYALAIVIALALAVGIPAAEVSVHRANVFLTIAGIAIAVTILRAIIPRRHPFVAPGPELTAAEQPELHALLTEVAHKAGEDPADHVYADLDVNAGVLEHRRRRMLVIGLPLLATMDIDELRSVVAHEYGHYRAGDTRFGVWIWRTRAAVSETVYALSTTESVFRRVVRIPFDAYADLFLRITNAISRRAEFVADQVSAEVAGPEAAGRALRRFVAVGGVYDEYWEDDVVPLLEASRCPPIVAGLTAVTAHLHLTGSLDDLVGLDIDDHGPDPYESHPTLRQRLEALGVEVTGAVPPPVAVPAATLLRDLPGVERAALRAQLGDEVAGFEPADWSEAGAIHLQLLRTYLEPFRGVVTGTIGDAGRLAADPPPALLSAVRETFELQDRDARPPAAHVLGALVVSAGAEAGARVLALPGEALMIELDGAGSINVWRPLHSFVDDPDAVGTWLDDPVVAKLRDCPL